MVYFCLIKDYKYKELLVFLIKFVVVCLFYVKGNVSIVCVFCVLKIGFFLVFFEILIYVCFFVKDKF